MLLGRLGLVVEGGDVGRFGGKKGGVVGLALGFDRQVL
jgi:hypothetical protein